MKVEFRVHTVAISSANVKAEIEGETITASAPALEVELVTLSERSGTLTLRFIGDAMNDAKELFKQDAYITADFAAK